MSSDHPPNNPADATKRMWGGRFEGESDPLFRAFNDSLPIDRALLPYDVRGSIAWAEALRRIDIFTADECSRVCDALREIEAVGTAEPQRFDNATDEDIHGWVERELIARVGDLGKKLHTGRSRNDQVATDFRLCARDMATERIAELRDLQHTLIQLARNNVDAVMPGYTHLQRAQPIVFAHWCLAYFEMFDRDCARFADALTRINVCPLGAAALAGTSFPIDRAQLATALGFDRPSENSLDAVADRDFVLDLLSAAVTCALHLSRMAEDLIIYNSAEFGFVEMSDAVTSGSSLMPQKKNPDAMELIRGKCGRIVGEFTALAVTIKGVSLAYNKDLQEDKLPLLTAMHELSMCLRMATRCMSDLKTNEASMLAAARGGHANATAFANYLVEHDIPFREAHEQTGRVVRLALSRGCTIDELSLDDLRTISSVVDDDVYEAISLGRVLNACAAHGGTAPQRVREAIERATARLDAP